MACDWEQQVKIQAPVAMVMQLVAAIYLVGGTFTGDLCVDMQGFFHVGPGTSGSSVTSSTPHPCDPTPSDNLSLCGAINDGDCDDGGPGSEYSGCSMNADATDCDSFNNPRTCPGRRHRSLRR